MPEGVDLVWKTECDLVSPDHKASMGKWWEMSRDWWTLWTEPGVDPAGLDLFKWLRLCNST